MPVPRPLALLLLLALLVLGGPAAALAQDASPEAADGYTATGDPLVGTGVPYLDERGDELGIVTVVEVTDPWEDFSEFFEVEEGSRFVGIEVSLEGTNAQIESSPSDFGLQTADGFFYSPTFVSRDVTSGDVPDLETITVDVDDVLFGLVFFQVPEDADLARIFWQPESGRLVLLADLRE